MKMEGMWFGYLTKSAHDSLSQYYEKSETWLESAKKDDVSEKYKSNKIAAKEHSLTKDEEYSEWDIKMQDHDITYEMFFTNYFRYSMVVLSALILEDHLQRFCNALYKLKGNIKKPPKPIGNIIKSYKEYIDAFNLSYDQSVWDFTEDFNHIRNCIVHASGDVSRRGKQEQACLKVIEGKNTGIHIGRRKSGYKLTPLYLDDDMIIIEPQYCKLIILNIKILFDVLNKAANIPTEITIEFNK